MKWGQLCLAIGYAQFLSTNYAHVSTKLYLERAVSTHLSEDASLTVAAIHECICSLSLGSLLSPQIRWSGCKVLVCHSYRQSIAEPHLEDAFLLGMVKGRLGPGTKLLWHLTGCWKKLQAWGCHSYFSIELAGEVPAPFIWVTPHFLQLVIHSNCQLARAVSSLGSLQGPAFCAQCH